MSDGKIEVRLATKERHFVRVFKDFLATKHLTTEEKMVYIALKSFVDFNEDEGQVYPSMDILCRLTSMSRPRATRTITSLIRKGIVKKERRGLAKTNVYTLYDNPSMWGAETEEELRELTETRIPYSTQELKEELKRRGVVIETQKEPVSATDQSTDTSTFSDNSATNNPTMREPHCQERYSIEDVRELFDYSILLNECYRQDVDSVISILYDTLNSTKKTIRISGEDRPTMAVISKLMKLSHEEILYSIEKYNSVTDRIKNPTAYMLTILYGAKEQMNLDINNQVHHDLNGK